MVASSLILSRLYLYSIAAGLGLPRIRDEEARRDE